MYDFDPSDRLDRETAACLRREELSHRRDAARRLRGDARALMSGRPDVDAPPAAPSAPSGLLGFLRSFASA